MDKFWKILRIVGQFHQRHWRLLDKGRMRKDLISLDYVLERSPIELGWQWLPRANLASSLLLCVEIFWMRHGGCSPDVRRSYVLRLSLLSLLRKRFALDLTCFHTKPRVAHAPIQVYISRIHFHGTDSHSWYSNISFLVRNLTETNKRVVLEIDFVYRKYRERDVIILFGICNEYKLISQLRNNVTRVVSWLFRPRSSFNLFGRNVLGVGIWCFYIMLVTKDTRNRASLRIRRAIDL